MTTRIALVIFLLIALAVAADVMFDDSEGLIFVIRRLFDLTGWVIFWR